MSTARSFILLFVLLSLATWGCAPQRGMAEADEVCDDTCSFAGDGECDDGGADSLYSVCDFGSDCEDCGTRWSDEAPEEESDDDDYAPAGSCNSYHFTCQGCSGSGTCSGNCPSSCYSLCADACSNGGCGSVVSCY